MRKDDFVLIVVLLVCVISAGLLAKRLKKTQDKEANSRHMIESKIPMGGFEKFASDIVWMKFLQYAGSNNMDEKTAPAMKRQVKSIISLDPDFRDVYFNGVLMLQNEDPEGALEIIDRAKEHPRMQNDWRLAQLGSQVIMRTEWLKHVNNEEMNVTRVKLAEGYLDWATKCDGYRFSILNSLIRLKAIIAAAENKLPIDVNVLKEWDKHVTLYTIDEENMEMGHEDASEMSFYMGDTAEMDGKILSTMNKVYTAYVNNKEVDETVRKEAELIVEKFRKERFLNDKFHPVTGKRYDRSALTSVAGTIPSPKAGAYIVKLHVRKAFSINELVLMTTGGKGQLTVFAEQEDGKMAAITGLEKVSFGPEKVMHRAMDQNYVRNGSRLEVHLTGLSEDMKDLSYSFEAYYGQY